MRAPLNIDARTPLREREREGEIERERERETEREREEIGGEYNQIVIRARTTAWTLFLRIFRSAFPVIPAYLQFCFPRGNGRQYR
jgi:hypothetical protein